MTLIQAPPSGAAIIVRCPLRTTMALHSCCESCRAVVRSIAPVPQWSYIPEQARHFSWMRREDSDWNRSATSSPDSLCRCPAKAFKPSASSTIVVPPVELTNQRTNQLIGFLVAGKPWPNNHGDLSLQTIFQFARKPVFESVPSSVSGRDSVMISGAKAAT